MKKFVIGNTVVDVIKDSLVGMVASKINCRGREDKDDAFFVADMGDIVRKLKLWNAQLSRVEPHYAVKCNDDPSVLAVLAQLGIGFDCASKAEIQKVLEMKVSPNRIVYANPCKQTSHIKYAAKRHVSMTTFDNETELYKMKAVHPDAKLILRILPPDDSKSQCQLGMKYGCHPKHAPQLLKKAKDLGLNVIGVSFHVGSGCYDATAFSAAVASARIVFDMAEKIGFNFDFLDIGGGFPGQPSAKVSFEEICTVLRPALDTYFPESMGVRIISEPGRFFVASAFTLAVNIIAKRRIAPEPSPPSHDGISSSEETKIMYYVNDGVYGSFNCLLYDHAIVEPCLVSPEDYNGLPRYESSIWGPTCDGLDCIMKEGQLPELFDGDWLVFKDMGAYTMCAASTFNGMPKPRCYYVMQECFWLHLSLKSVDCKELPLLTQLKAGHEVTETEMHTIQECLTALEV